MSLLKNAKAKFADFWSKPQERDLSKKELLTTARRKLYGGFAAEDAESFMKGLNNMTLKKKKKKAREKTE
jgi:hypothetical protein